MNQMKIVFAAALLASNVASFDVDDLGYKKINCYFDASDEATGSTTGTDFGACDALFPNKRPR